ncbi:DUF2141 domain-containing protein [Polymorphobacter fuscus]|uniref:DUF2141 domain-containing protein n=1 Tax=Sandarakinorhabdus fusca TaxID=1439888 RepID=A0A7C9GNW3_9SPHN|nr:DUF2141 domain-containing protein [Polymorphobacter fuscus]KAB7649123.1 DUF2141 domain-containing protein [Polymorphobacter fuscus]MQT16573.1 DUF2141 domain-containing protein [Polymorphobacter fuscus]
MRTLAALLVAAAPIAAAAAAPAAGYLPSTPDLGKAEAQCRPGETGPAVLVLAVGLKDREGRMKAELYPANEEDFLADDNVLIMAGKTFRRVEIPVPPSGPVQLCIRLPGPGQYALVLLHDRDSNRKFGLSTDGIGFSNNPKLGLSKPKADAVRFTAGSGLTPVTVRMNYRHGLFGFGPLKN